MTVLAGFVMIQQIISVRNVRGRVGLEKQHSITAPLAPPPPSPMERAAARENYLAPPKGGEGEALPGGGLTDAAVVELVTTGKNPVSTQRNMARYIR